MIVEINSKIVQLFKTVTLLQPWHCLKIKCIGHTRMHRPIIDYTTHIKQQNTHITITEQNTHITITEQIHNRNKYVIFFYLLAVIVIINFI